MLPSINSHKKPIKFSNPLTGIIYSNTNFVNQIYSEPNNDKQSTFQLQSQEPQSNKKNNNKLFHSHKKSLTIQPYPDNNRSLSNNSSMKISKNTVRNKKKRSDYFGGTIDSHHLNTTNALADYQINANTSGNYHVHTQRNSEVSGRGYREKQEKNLLQNVVVVFLDLIQIQDDCVDKIVEANFGKYFKVFFNKKLTGPLTMSMLTIIDKYIKIIVSENLWHISPSDYHPHLFQLTTKKEVLHKILELQQKSRKYQIIAMIIYYFMPAENVRLATLKDIIFNLKKEADKKFKLKFNPKFKQLFDLKQQFHIIQPNGKIVKDISEISCFTDKIFLLSNQNLGKSKDLLQYYCSKLENDQIVKSKHQFTEGIKINFRTLITKGNYDQKLGQRDFDGDFVRLLTKRRRKAENLVQMHRNSIKIQYKNETLSSRRLSQASRFAKNSSNLSSLSAHKNNSSTPKKNPEIKPISSQPLFYKINEKISNLKNKLSSNQIIKILQAQQISIDQIEIMLTNQQYRIQIQNKMDNILHFIDAYLFQNFNHYVINTEISYYRFTQVLDAAMIDHTSQKYYEKDSYLIIQMIWTWLEDNGLIQYYKDSEPDELMELTEEDKYVEKGYFIRQKFIYGRQKYSLFHELLISLVFKKYQKSMLEMIYQILLPKS